MSCSLFHPIEIPHFKDVIIMATSCDACLQLLDPEDFSRELFYFLKNAGV
jgi:hypothetical protein